MPARFLAAVLERIESQIDHVGRLRMTIYSHDRAFFVEFVEHLSLVLFEPMRQPR